MSSIANNIELDRPQIRREESPLLAPVLHWSPRMILPVAGLGSVVLLGLFAYVVQLRDGLAVTGMRDTVSWGLYITNFVFFIGISHVGALLSSILRLTGARWRHPITRMAEAITFSALLFGAIMPIIDLGRPDRMLNLVLHGRLQSPILWDLLSISTYLAGSTMFLFLPLIPDLARLRDTPERLAGWRRAIYRFLALGWRGTRDQRTRLERGMGVMAVLILPIAVMVHTVVSWIFAMTLRPGWNSTIFGPYFVAGALASGAASVVLAMVVFRKMYRLERWVTEDHFRKMATLVLVLDLVYLYFNLAEYVTSAYKMEMAERALLFELFQGPLAPLFWFTQVFGLVIPAFLLILPSIRYAAGSGEGQRTRWLRRAGPLAGGLACAFTFGLLPRWGAVPEGWALALRIASLGLVAVGAISWMPVLRSRPIPSFVIACSLIVIQAWVKRFIIVVPVLEHHFLGVHDPIATVAMYRPTWVEWSITAGSLAGFLLVYYLFSRFFPIVSVWETEAADEEVPEPVPSKARRSSASVEVA